MPIVISPWEVRFKNHTVFGKTKEEALDRAKEEIEECKAKGLQWDLYCKTDQEIALKKAYDKGWDEGHDSGYEQGRLDVFEDQLGIKYTTWSVHTLNGEDWSLGDKNLDHPLTSDKNKKLKIVYNYRWFDEDYKVQNSPLTGSAKNSTIGEIWKGIERLYIKCEIAGTAHSFIESIYIKDNTLTFYTGS